MTPLSFPHLPEQKVRLCAIGQGFPAIRQALESFGVDVLELAPCPTLPMPVANHGDLLLHHLGGKKVLLAQPDPPAQQVVQNYQMESEVLSQPLGGLYPEDIALNCFCLGNYIWGNTNHLAPELLFYYQSLGREWVTTRQGYAKCSTCIVDDSSIITADPSIASAARNLGFDVLEIASGQIALPGYDFGFIGGCSGKLAPDKLAFCGAVSAHSHYKDIQMFCSKRGVECLELGNFSLTDIGGILPLLQEE